MMGKITIMVVLCSLACVQGQFFEDRRCRCVCPSPASVLNISSTRQIFTGNVPPNKCHCEGVVIPLIGKEIEGKVHLLCPRCECSYQTRNTTLIMGVVFLMLTLIGMAVIYMITLLWLNTWVMSQRTETPRDAIEDGKGRTEEEVEMGFKDVAEHGLTNDSGGAKKENQTTSILSTKNEYFWIKSLPAFIIILGSIFVQKLPRLLGRWNWAALTAPQTMNRPSTPDSDDGDHNADNAPTNGPIRVVDEHWARPVPGTPDLIRPATPPDRMQLSSPDQTPPAEAPEAPRRRGGNSLMTLRDLERVNYKPFFRRQSINGKTMDSPQNAYPLPLPACFCWEEVSQKISPAIAAVRAAARAACKRSDYRRHSQLIEIRTWKPARRLAARSTAAIHVLLLISALKLCSNQTDR